MHLEHLQLCLLVFIIILGFSKSLSIFHFSLAFSSKSKLKLNLLSYSLFKIKKFIKINIIKKDFSRKKFLSKNNY